MNLPRPGALARRAGTSQLPGARWQGEGWDSDCLPCPMPALLCRPEKGRMGVWGGRERGHTVVRGAKTPTVPCPPQGP